jgi:hypothetical protein
MKYLFTWVDGKETVHETDLSLADYISNQSVSAGYHIGDCLKSAVLIDEPQQEMQDGQQQTAAAQTDGNDGAGPQDSGGQRESLGGLDQTAVDELDAVEDAHVASHESEASQRRDRDETGRQLLNQ